jgi:transglutaminase-like putative cysteine protease
VASREQLASAVRAVGGEVAEVVGDVLGHPRMFVRVRDNTQAIALINELARRDATNDDVRSLAWRLVGNAHDPLVKAQRIQEIVQRYVRFVPESNERFQAPLYTMRWGGDCDDHARLVVACNLAVGNDAHAEPTFSPSDDSIRHVSPRVRIGGVYRWSETTCLAEWDEHPRAAGIRLGLVRSDMTGG